MSYRSDITIQDRAGRTVAVVEVKNQSGLSTEAATDLRRTLADYGLFFSAPYFLLLSQQRGYLWTPKEALDPGAQPSYTFPMQQVVAKYWPGLPSTERLRSSELELMVRNWLTALTWGAADAREEPDRTLALAGFLESIRDGEVAAQLPV